MLQQIFEIKLTFISLKFSFPTCVVTFKGLGTFHVKESELLILAVVMALKKWNTLLKIL